MSWRHQQRLELAIKYCQIAADRGLTDDTNSGLAGRLKRLETDRARSGQSG
jgi:hypothetical protein